MFEEWHRVSAMVAESLPADAVALRTVIRIGKTIAEIVVVSDTLKTESNRCVLYEWVDGKLERIIEPQGRYVTKAKLIDLRSLGEQWGFEKRVPEDVGIAADFDFAVFDVEELPDCFRVWLGCPPHYPGFLVVDMTKEYFLALPKRDEYENTWRSIGT